MLADVMSVDELCDSAKKKLKLNGNKMGAKLIDTVFDQQAATEIMSTIKKYQSSKIRKMNPEEALEMLITCNLTKSSYNEIRRRAQKCGHDLYPSYKLVFTL